MVVFKIGPNNREALLRFNRRIILIFTIPIVVGLTVYFFSNYGISEGEVIKLKDYLTLEEYGKFDSRLMKYYVTKNMNPKMLNSYAKNDCYEKKFEKEKDEFLKEYMSYAKELKERITLHLAILPEKMWVKSYSYLTVPETDVCILVRISDKEGVGVIGYEDKNRELRLFNLFELK